MNRKILNIISIFLIMALLPATSGVALFHHICNANGTHSVSLYSETKCDHHEETTGVCEHCMKDIAGCSLDGNNSCIEYFDFLSIDADFVSSSKLILQPQEFDSPLKEQHELYSILFQDFKLTKDYFKQDIKLPVQNNISFIIFNSLNKSSDDTSDSYIS